MHRPRRRRPDQESTDPAHFRPEPAPPYQFLQTDPRQAWDALLVAPPNGTMDVQVRNPNGWTSELVPLGADRAATRLHRVRFVPVGAGGAPELALN